MLCITVDASQSYKVIIINLQNSPACFRHTSDQKPQVNEVKNEFHDCQSLLQTILYSINSSISDNKQWTMLIISMPVHKWNSVYWSHKQYKLNGNCTQTAKTLMCCLMPYIILKVTHALFTKQLLLFFLIVVIFNKCILVSRSEQ